jgi:hypothetical protein
MAFYANVLMQGTDNAINSPMASLKGMSLAQRNCLGHRPLCCSRHSFLISLLFSFDLVVIVIVVRDRNLSAQHWEHGPAKLGIQTEAVPKVGEGSVPWLSVCLLHPPLPPIVVVPTPTPHPKWFRSIASPVVNVVVPSDATLIALFFIVLLQRVGDAPQAHHAQIPRCLLLSCPMPDDDNEDDNGDEDNEEGEAAVPMESRPSR